jgi:isopenicillin N synthase-like dioxygenase
MISNGIIKSPLHRVLTNTENDRISVVMFYGPGPEKELQPANELVTDKRPALYKKVKAKDYATVLFDTFARGGRAVDLFKVE